MNEVLGVDESLALVSRYIPVLGGKLVRRFEEIKIPAPLVLKLVSRDAIHKTDVGGVRIVRRADEVEHVFMDMMRAARRRRMHVRGILVQPFYEGIELLMGIVRDGVFGHMISVGIGGIYTEIYGDVVMRKCPISMNDAREMIGSLRGKGIFHARGMQFDVGALTRALVALSNLPGENSGVVEIDINPFMLQGHGGKAVDARVVFGKVNPT